MLHIVIAVLAVSAWAVLTLTWWAGLFSDWRVIVTLNAYNEAWAEGVLMHAALAVSAVALVLYVRHVR